jgi:hypothetical protein
LLIQKPFYSGFFASGSLGVQLGQSAALYCRVSTADQTCARQERDLRAFAKKAGYKVVGVWKETASGAKDARAERKKVLALAQSRSIDVILVTEINAMDRDTIRRIFTENVGKWVRVSYVDGGGHFVFIINVDQKGYVHRLNDDDDEMFWTTFDDIQAVWPVGDLNATQPD